jgi:predicted HTH transcriptional regulator
MPPLLRALKQQGEGQQMEFKNGLAKGGKPGEKKAETRKVLTSVAAFMNSRRGGNVLLGVEDDGTIVGVEDEYSLIDPHSANWDGYDRYLNSVLTDKLNVDSPFSYFTVERYHEDGKEICCIRVEPSDRPVFLDDLLYLRVGAQNQPLKARDVLSYAAERWSWLGVPPKIRTGEPGLESRQGGEKA